MEAQVKASQSPTAVPPYETWPSVPTAPPNNAIKDEQTSAMDIDDIKSNSDRYARQNSELSMDDIEAAQALEGLRADTRQVRLPDTVSKIGPTCQNPPQNHQHPEPLLSLFISRYPGLRSPINGSLNAYSSSKSYSPSFRYGAEIVERLSSPVVTTIGTASRGIKVEKGVRWLLQKNDAASPQPGSKRRRTDQSPMDLDMERGFAASSLRPDRRRQMSEISYSDVPPPYDPQRTPEYEEKSPSHESPDEHHSDYHPSWSTRLIKSTSGLGVAMSEESLASLRWALECLSWANRHLNRLILRLRDAIEQSKRGEEPLSTQSSDSADQQDTQMIGSAQHIAMEKERERNIESLAAEVIYIIKRVNNGVSEYAASALPENARILVGRYLKSLHISFQKSFAVSKKSESGQQDGVTGSETSARKALLLAREALDKLAQVGGIVEGTIVSAEEWCDRFGKRRSNRLAGEDGDQNSSADRKQPLVLNTIVDASQLTNGDRKCQPLMDIDVSMADKEEA